MLIVLHGYYGYGNLGDDLMLHVLLEELSRRRPAARLRVLHHRDAEPSFIPVPAGVDVEFRCDSTWRQRYEALAGADALIFGGGTCLHRFGFCGLYNNMAARVLGVPVLWLGVGADEVGGGKAAWKAKLSLHACDAATWRDQPSAEIAERLVRRFEDSLVADDLAFLILESPALSRLLTSGPATAADRPLLVGWRSLQGYLSPAEEQAGLRHAADAIAAVATEHGFRVVQVIDLADLVDGDANARLTQLLRQRDVAAVHQADLTMEEKLTAVRDAGGAIFGRLHGLLLAQLCGIPSVGVSYASKMDNFGRLFDKPPLVPLKAVVANSQQLAECFSQQRLRGARWRRPVSEHLAAARRHWDVLDLHLPAQRGSAA